MSSKNKAGRLREDSGNIMGDCGMTVGNSGEIDFLSRTDLSVLFFA
jgi:hypothetical protein